MQGHFEKLKSMKIFKIKLGATQVPAVIEMANEFTFVMTLYDKNNYRSIYFIIIIIAY